MSSMIFCSYSVRFHSYGNKQLQKIKVVSLSFFFSFSFFKSLLISLHECIFPICCCFFFCFLYNFATFLWLEYVSHLVPLKWQHQWIMQTCMFSMQHTNRFILACLLLYPGWMSVTMPLGYAKYIFIKCCNFNLFVFFFFSLLGRRRPFCSYRHCLLIALPLHSDACAYCIDPTQFRKAKNTFWCNIPEHWCNVV